MRCSNKLAACILTSFLAFALPGVAQPLQVPRTLTVAVAYAPKSLDALTATDAAAARTLQLTHPALLSWSRSYQPAANAALGCTQLQPTRVTCTLRPNLHFTSGNPFTAHAVATWFTTVQSTPRSPLSAALKDVTIAATNSTTLTFTLSKPSLSFLGTLTEVPVADPTAPAHGLGPYQLKELSPLGNVTLTTSRADLPQTLAFTFVADTTTRLLKLKKGEVDAVLADLTPEQFAWGQQQGFTALATPGTSYSYLGLNFQNEYLAQPAVREVLAMAINRAGIRQHLLGGAAAPASSLLPPGHPAFFAAPEEAYNPEEAEATLDAIPLLPSPEGPRFELTLLTSTDGFAQRVAQVIQNQLGKVGIAVHLKPTEWASFYTAVKKGQFDMVLLTWTGEQQPSFYHSVFHSSQMPPVGFNRGRFKNAEVDALTEALLTAPSLEEQNRLAVETQKKLATLKPYIPLYRRPNLMLARPSVVGCTLPASGAYLGLATCRLKP